MTPSIPPISSQAPSETRWAWKFAYLLIRIRAGAVMGCALLFCFAHTSRAEWVTWPPTTLAVNTYMPQCEVGSYYLGTPPGGQPWMIYFWTRNPSGVWTPIGIGSTGGTTWSGFVSGTMFRPAVTGGWLVQVNAQQGSPGSFPAGTMIVTNRMIDVQSPNSAPTVSWTSTNPSSMSYNSTARISILATDPDNNLGSLRIWMDGEDPSTDQLVISGSGSSNHSRWIYPSVGNHTVYAQAIDAAGAASSTLSFSVTVSPPSVPPTGYTKGGVDIASRLYPKVTGSAALPSGVLVNGTDINQLFNRIEDSRTDIFRDLSNVPLVEPTGLVNYPGKPITLPNAVLPDGSTGQVIEFGDNPFHVMFELNVCAPGFLKKNTTYIYGFWARTVSGFRHIAIATSWGADGNGLVYTDAEGNGSQFIDTNWRWIQVERSFQNDDFVWARFHMVVGGVDVPFQIYKPTIVESRLTNVRSIGGYLQSAISVDVTRWPDIAFRFAPTNGL